MSRSITIAGLFVVFLAGLLFAAAGSTDWIEAWAFLAAYTGFVIAAFLWLPSELLQARGRPGSDVVRSDVYLASLGGFLLYPGTLLVAGLDHARALGSPGMSSSLEAAGLTLFVVGYGYALWAMRANPFFESFVRVQSERGHRVISNGPYAQLRHPGYAGALAAHLAIPFALGSWAALVPALLGAAVFVIRTKREDELLAEKLPGYREYQSSVRWRLVPGIW